MAESNRSGASMDHGEQQPESGTTRLNNPKVLPSQAGQDNNGSDHGDRSSDSLACRLTASATGLSRTMLGGTMPDTGAAGPANKQRNVGSSLGSSRVEMSETARLRNAHGQGSRFGHSSAPGSANDTPYGAFIAEQAVLTESALVHGQQSDAGKSFIQSPNVQPVHQHGLTAVAQQEAQDGTAVAQLLMSLDMLDMDETLDFEPGLDARDLETLRRALFEPAYSRRSEDEWDTLLNFHPKFLLEDDTAGLEMHLGTNDAADGGLQWVAQWRDVLDSYTDVVWGDLEMLVKDARHELSQVQKQKQKSNSPEQQPDLKALRRLRQILAQVRGM